MPGNEHWADEIAASLHAEMPWFGPANEAVWHALRVCAQRGEPIKLTPLLLNGPVGIGKSYWARKLSEKLQTGFFEVDASKSSAGFGLVGLERGWGSAQPGRPIEVILRDRVINPIGVIDEVCKAKTATTSKGHSFSFSDALLSLLEPSTSQKWECPYFRVSFDMSRISWILTSNYLERVDEPVRSRCQVIELRTVSEEELVNFARQRGLRMGLSDLSNEVVAEVIPKAARQTGRRLSLRDVGRLLERAQALEQRPTVH